MQVEIFSSFATSSLNAKKYEQSMRFLLDIKKIKYEIYDIGTDADKKEEMFRRSGKKTFPQLHVNGKFIGEWEEVENLNETDELDKILGLK